MRGKWTPGPWLGTVEFKPPSGDRRNIAILCGGDSPRGQEARANFNLAFAAPALYAALEAVTTAFSVAHIAQGLDPGVSESLRQARAALSLAHTEPSQRES